MKIKFLFFIILINFFLVVPFLNPVRAIFEEGCSQESYKQQKADRIVTGTVGETNCTEDVCLTSVQVEENLKGTGALKIFVETPGAGTPVLLSEPADVWVEDSPTFQKGDKVKLYLKSTAKSDTYTLVCDGSGKVLPGEEIPEPEEITGKSIPVLERIKVFFAAIINQLKQIFKFKNAPPDKSKYCVDYLGNPEPEGHCSTVGIEERKCKSTEDCRATCAFGCVSVNRNWGASGRNDCTAEPQYECECINNFCQVKTPETLPEKITFNSLFYVPAKCLLSASAKVKIIGVSEEGASSNIPDSEIGILLNC